MNKQKPMTFNVSTLLHKVLSIYSSYQGKKVTMGEMINQSIIMYFKEHKEDVLKCLDRETQKQLQELLGKQK